MTAPFSGCELFPLIAKILHQPTLITRIMDPVGSRAKSVGHAQLLVFRASGCRICTLALEASVS